MSEIFKNRNLPLLLSQLREQVISHFRPLLNHFGLTEQQWRVLRVLCEQEQMEPRELCQVCQILSPSMAGILRRLEEMELVQRQPVEGDKRRVFISLTDTSKQLIEQMAPLVQQQYRNLEQAWGKQRLHTLYDSIDTLMECQTLEVKRVELPDAAK